MIRLICLLCLLPVPLLAQVHCTWDFYYFTGTSNGVRRVEITPTAWGVSGGNRFITPDRIRYTNDASGSLTVSNMATNILYRVEFFGQFATFAITNYFPPGTTGAVSAASYLTATNAAGAAAGYTIAQANARFYLNSNPSNYITSATITGKLDATNGTGYGALSITSSNATGSNAVFRLGDATWRYQYTGTGRKLFLDEGTNSTGETYFNLTSGAFFVPSIEADGSGLTDLNGANIQADTISSNSFDVATRALLGGGGSGDISATSSNNMVANLTDNTVLVGLFTKSDYGFYPAVSGDGANWKVGQGGVVNVPSSAVTNGNNSFIRVGPKRYLMATRYSSGPWGFASYITNVGFYLSTNLLAWDFVTNWPASYASAARQWAPELHLGNDGEVYCYGAVSTSTNPATAFQIYVMRALDTNYTSWTTQTQITNLPSNVIDPFMVQDGGTNYLFYKDESDTYIEVAASTASLTNGFSVIASNDWAGWGSQVEAQAINKLPDGRWLIVFDAYIEGVKYYSTSSNLLGGWSAKRAFNFERGATNYYTHGTVRGVPSGEAASLISDTQSGTNIFTRLGKLSLTSPTDDYGQLRIFSDSAASKAEIGLYPNATVANNYWLVSSLTNTFSLYTPEGDAVKYFRANGGYSRTWFFYNNLRVNDGAGTIWGNPIGNGAGLTNLNGTVVYTNAGSATFTNGRITIVTNGFGGGSSSSPDAITNSLLLVSPTGTLTVDGAGSFATLGLVGVKVTAAYGGGLMRGLVQEGYTTNVIRATWVTTNAVPMEVYVAYKYFTHGDNAATARTVSATKFITGSAGTTNILSAAWTNTSGFSGKTYLSADQLCVNAATTNALWLIAAESIWLK